MRRLPRITFPPEKVSPVHWQGTSLHDFSLANSGVLGISRGKLVMSPEISYVNYQYDFSKVITDFARSSFE